MAPLRFEPEWCVTCKRGPPHRPATRRFGKGRATTRSCHDDLEMTTIVIDAVGILCHVLRYLWLEAKDRLALVDG